MHAPSHAPRTVRMRQPVVNAEVDAARYARWVITIGQAGVGIAADPSGIRLQGAVVTNSHVKRWPATLARTCTAQL
jgi:hypothetical protein